MAKIYEDFLRLTGFDEDEMSRYIPEWRDASRKLGLTEDDIRYATQQRIPEYLDVDLKGVRKALACIVKETIDLTKANEYKKKGVKIVYGIMPAIIHFYYALKLTSPHRVFVSFPDYFLVLALNTFFHKLSPVLNLAEKNGISYGCRHCALNKTRSEARRSGLIPSPDVSWIWGFICDEGPKTDEFIKLHHDPEWETYVTRIPHDQPLGTIEDEVIERVAYLASQMKDGFEFVQKKIGIQVQDAKIKAAQKLWQSYAIKFERLNRLAASDPITIGAISLRIFDKPLGLPFNTGIEPMEEALDIVLEEVKERAAKGKGIMPKGAPKLMAYYLPFAVPWITKMFEQNGVGLIFSEVNMPSKKQLQPPSFTDPYMATAEAWLRQSSAVNPAYEAQIICGKMETLDVDGMVFGLFDFDRWLGSGHKLLAKMVEEKTQKPVFYIEGDIWDDRDYSKEALRTRIESIAEIVKMRKS